MVTKWRLDCPNWSAKAVAEGMGNTLQNTVLRRKATVGRQVHEARAMSPSKALRLAVEKAADEELDLVLAVTETERSVVGHAQLLEKMEEKNLIVMLDGPDGLRGAFSVDIQVISALIEAQTMGRVFPRDADARKITQTDGAISVPLIDGILARFEVNLAEEDDNFWSGGYAFGVRMEDSRALGLALDEPDYNLFQLTVDVDRGARKGRILMALPVREKPRLSVGVENADANGDGQVSLEGRVMGARARLDAILCRISLPLSAVSGLKPGDVLPLAPDAIRETQLEATPKRKVAMARLGQMNGNRALCLTGLGLPPRKDQVKQDSDEPSGMAIGADIAEPDFGGSMEMDLPAIDPAGLPELDIAPMDMDIGGDDLPDLSDLDMGGDMPMGDFGAAPMGDLPDLGDLGGDDMAGELPPLDMSSGLD